MAKPIKVHHRFAAWRAYRGLSLGGIGRTIGKTRQFLSLVERGESRIVVDDLEEICAKAFRCSMVEFFGPLPKIPEAA